MKSIELYCPDTNHVVFTPNGVALIRSKMKSQITYECIADHIKFEHLTVMTAVILAQAPMATDAETLPWY